MSNLHSKKPFFHYQGDKLGEIQFCPSAAQVFALNLRKSDVPLESTKL